jgi:hypothetical protein
LLYTARGTLTPTCAFPTAPPAVSDDNNLYFNDVLVGTSSTVQGIWQVPLAGGTPTALLSYTVPVNTAPSQLIGSNNAVLVILATATDPSTQALTDSLGTLTVGTLNSGASPLGPTLNGAVSAFMLSATAGVRSSDLVFVSAQNPVSSAGVFSSEVLGTDGSSKQALTSNSYFLADAASPLSGAVLQLTGINTAVPGMGGGPIQVVALSTLTATALKTSGGGSYTLPNGFEPALLGLSPQIGAGDALPLPPAAGNGTGLVFNLSSDVIVPVSIVNTSVTLF